MAAIVEPYLEPLAEDEDKRLQVKQIIKRLEEEILRQEILTNRKRFDGRSLDQIRGIEIDVGPLPRTHGSALFTRGETQALVSATLGTSRDAQIIEEYEGESRQKFILHYSFPPFSVGEVKFLRGPSRREIGPRRPSPACPDSPTTSRRRLSLYDSRSLRHPRIERLLLDGDGLRRLSSPLRRRSSDARPSRRRRHGAHQE